MYVKGHNKAKFLKKLINKKVVNLETFGCPKLAHIKNSSEFCIYPISNNNVKCFYHSFNRSHCALLNVMMLSYWFKYNIVKKL